MRTNEASDDVGTFVISVAGLWSAVPARLNELEITSRLVNLHELNKQTVPLLFILLLDRAVTDRATERGSKET